MEQILEFFEHPPITLRAGVLIGGLVFFWILEGVIPLFRFQYSKTKHAGLNIVFTAIAMAIGFAMAFLLLLAADFTQEHNFGLLQLVALPLWAEVVLGIMLLDLIGAYFVHFVEHKVKWMWKFHLIHHTDRNVDVTTGLRHHPGEILFRISFTILGILVAGVPIAVVMIYQTLSVLFTHLTHANMDIPNKVDHILSYVFVSPNMHKVHHHFEQPLTDTNYGNIFSLWDRLFGTYVHVEDPHSIQYGIDTHLSPVENEDIKNLLSIPFQPYRQAEKTGVAVQSSNSGRT